MSAPILALLNLPPLRSNWLRRAMTRAPEKLAPLNVGASAREISNPDETTSPRRLAFDRSALVKFALIIQARSSFALERFAPEKSAPSNFAPKKFAPDRLTPLKSELLRSRFSSDFPYVDDPHLARCFAVFDQIACVHMSGLFVRSHMSAGQDGFRDKSSKQNGDFKRATGKCGMSLVGDR